MNENPGDSIFQKKLEAQELFELSQFENIKGNYELSQELFDEYSDLMLEIEKEEMLYKKKPLKLKLKFPTTLPNKVDEEKPH